MLHSELAGVFVSKEPLDKNVHGVVSLCKSGRENAWVLFPREKASLMVGQLSWRSSSAFPVATSNECWHKLTWKKTRKQ